MRFYGMLSIADTFDEINKFSQTSSLNLGTKNICLCKENGKFYESSGSNYFECSEINSMLKAQEVVKPVVSEPVIVAPPAPVAPRVFEMPLIKVGEQEMDLQTFANETVDTLKILNDFKTKFENIFNGGTK